MLKIKIPRNFVPPKNIEKNIENIEKNRKHLISKENRKNQKFYKIIKKCLGKNIMKQNIKTKIENKSKKKKSNVFESNSKK